MSQSGRVTKPGRQRPRVPMDERLRATRACEYAIPTAFPNAVQCTFCLLKSGQGCQRSKNKCVLPNTVGRQCTRCQRKLLDCSFGSVEDGNASRLTLEHSMASMEEGTSMTVDDDDGQSGQEQFESPMLLQASDTQSAETQPHSESAVDHLSQLLSRVREAMYGSTATDRQEAPREIRQDSNTDQSQYRDIFRQFPPKSVADFLSSCCYDLATDSFFYFDQQAFQSRLEQLYHDESSHLREDGVFLCLVLMVFALGSQFAHLRTKTSPAYTSGISRCPGKYFYSIATQLLPTTTFDCSIQAIQVCLVTAVYLLPEHVYDKAYLYLGHALRIAISLDLHRQKVEPRPSCRKSEINHRLWWSLFSLDRTVSIKLGRPASIANSEIHTPLPKALASLDHVQCFDNITHQVANAKLVLIMDSIVKDTGPGTTATIEGLARIERLQRDLATWRSSLAPNLKLGGLDSSCKEYRTVVHLHLNFHFALILLCRSALLFLVRRHLKRLFGRLDDSRSFDVDRLERLADDCADAAKSIIGLFEMLQQTGNLGVFSFTDFQGCSTATVILLLNSMRCGNKTSYPLVNTGFSCLRYMATENQHAKTGIRYVEELHVVANEVIEKFTQLSAINRDKSMDSHGVHAYQNWIQAVSDGSSSSIIDHGTTTATSSDTTQSPSCGRSLPFQAEQPTTVDGSELFALDPTFDFAEPATILPEDLSDTLLFGLTGLDALDFLVSDDQFQ